MVSEAVLNAAPENELIRNTMKKADLLLNSYKNPVCSVSGGSLPMSELPEEKNDGDK